MSTTDDNPTPLSQQAAQPSDPPSWHGPITALQEADVRHEARLSKLESKLSERLDSIDGSLATLAAAGSAVVKNPDVRKYALSILGSVAFILSVVAAALAGRASSVPPPAAPAPAAVVTVVMPKEIPQ